MRRYLFAVLVLAVIGLGSLPAAAPAQGARPASPRAWQRASYRSLTF